MPDNAKSKLAELKATIAKRKARAAQLAKETEADRKMRSAFGSADSRKFAAKSTKADRSWNGTGSTTKGEFLTGPLKPGESRTYTRAKKYGK